MAEGMFDPYDHIPLEVWDPQLGQNVFTQGNNANYVQANPEHYQGYSGPIEFVGNQPNVGSIAIHPEAFGVETGTRQGVPQPIQDYRNQYEQTAVNPYQDQTELLRQREAFMRQMQVAPGVRPNFGFIPGLGGWDLENMLPATWEENRNWESRRRAPLLTPEEDRITQTASDRRWQTPRVTDVVQEQTGREWPRWGRGWQYGGEPSPEEAQMTADLMAGRPVDYNRLFQMRQSRIQAVQPTAIQNIARQYYGPGLVALMGAATGVAGGGALLGAGMGALMQGGMTNWKNPAAIGLGAAGGALGGWGGGAAAGALGAGPVVQGAAAGAGAGLGGQLGYQVGTGHYDPTRLVTSTATGAATGAAGGATGLPPSVFSPAANVVSSFVNPPPAPAPRRRRPLRPMTSARNPYR